MSPLRGDALKFHGVPSETAHANYTIKRETPYGIINSKQARALVLRTRAGCRRSRRRRDAGFQLQNGILTERVLLQTGFFVTAFCPLVEKVAARRPNGLSSAPSLLRKHAPFFRPRRRSRICPRMTGKGVILSAAIPLRGTRVSRP